jgi:hypothetical protein
MPALEQAVLQTLAYVDMYDYPLTVEEIHRYLIAVRATRTQVESALDNGRLIDDHIQKVEGYYFLRADRRSHSEGRRILFPQRPRRYCRNAPPANAGLRESLAPSYLLWPAHSGLAFREHGRRYRIVGGRQC